MTDYAMSHPAATGETVTQGHADYCAAHGHSTYTVDGEVAPWCARCGEDRDASIYSMTDVADAELPGAVAKVGLYVKEMTGTGLDYTPDELDDLTDRKVEEVPFSGDALALIIRARRGTSRATGDIDHYSPRVVNNEAERNLWPTSERTAWTARADGNRRMAAIGAAGKWGFGYTESAERIRQRLNL